MSVNVPRFGFNIHYSFWEWWEYLLAVDKDRVFASVLDSGISFENCDGKWRQWYEEGQEKFEVSKLYLRLKHSEWDMKSNHSLAISAIAFGFALTAILEAIRARRLTRADMNSYTWYCNALWEGSRFSSEEGPRTTSPTALPHKVKSAYFRLNARPRENAANIKFCSNLYLITLWFNEFLEWCTAVKNRWNRTRVLPLWNKRQFLFS